MSGNNPCCGTNFNPHPTCRTPAPGIYARTCPRPQLPTIPAPNSLSNGTVFDPNATGTATSFPSCLYNSQQPCIPGPGQGSIVNPDGTAPLCRSSTEPVPAEEHAYAGAIMACDISAARAFYLNGVPADHRYTRRPIVKENTICRDQPFNSRIIRGPNGCPISLADIYFEGGCGIDGYVVGSSYLEVDGGSMASIRGVHTKFTVQNNGTTVANITINIILLNLTDCRSGTSCTRSASTASMSSNSSSLPSSCTMSCGSSCPSTSYSSCSSNASASMSNNSCAKSCSPFCYTGQAIIVENPSYSVEPGRFLSINALYLGNPEGTFFSQPDPCSLRFVVSMITGDTAGLIHLNPNTSSNSRVSAHRLIH